MATFGDLVVRLGLDKTGFDRGIGGVRGALTSMKSLGLGAAAGFTAVAGAATAAAFALKAWLEPSFESLDVLGDLSSRLGVATDTLAGLQFASKLAGVEQETLTIGITKFLDTLSNAGRGTKTAVDAFAALGLKAKDLQGLALDQQFVAVADALQGIKNPADRVRIAIDLFGKSGAQMLQLFNDGGQSLIATLEEARRIGIAPTNEEISKIQAANDAIDKMKAAWDGVANTIAINIAPTIQLMAVQVNVLLEALQAFASGKGFDLKESLNRNVKAWADSERKRMLNNLKPPGTPAPLAGGPERAPNAPLFDKFGKGLALDSRMSAGAKNFAPRTGELRQSVAPGGMKGAQDTLARILRAGSHTKDPTVKPAQETAKNTASIAKSIQKFINNAGGGLQVGAAGAGV